MGAAEYTELNDEDEPINWGQKLYGRFHNVSKLFYPNRPIVSLLIGMTVVLLAYAGFFPLSVGLLFGIGYIVDDLIITPFLGLAKYIRNLTYGEKKLKSIFGILAILAGYTLGFLLGYFVFMGMPTVLALIPPIQAGVHTSITIFALSVAAAIGVAKFMRLSPMYLLWLTWLIFLIFPIPTVVSASVDVLVTSVVISSFVASLVIKHLMRFACWAITGKTNGDSFVHVQDEELFERQAQFFKITKDQYMALKKSIVDMITSIENISPLPTKITGSSKLEKNSYKNMMYLLLYAKDKTDLENLQELLGHNDLHKDSLVELDGDDTESEYYVFRKIQIMLKNWRLYRTSYKYNADEVYGKDFSFSKSFAIAGAPYNTYSKSEHGFNYKTRLHHQFARYAQLKCKQAGGDAEKARKAFQMASKDIVPKAEWEGGLTIN